MAPYIAQSSDNNIKPWTTRSKALRYMLSVTNVTIESAYYRMSVSGKIAVVRAGIVDISSAKTPPAQSAMTPTECRTTGYQAHTPILLISIHGTLPLCRETHIHSIRTTVRVPGAVHSYATVLLTRQQVSVSLRFCGMGMDNAPEYSG